MYKVFTQILQENQTCTTEFMPTNARDIGACRKGITTEVTRKRALPQAKRSKVMHEVPIHWAIAQWIALQFIQTKYNRLLHVHFLYVHCTKF